jgi:hypothetical protein
MQDLKGTNKYLETMTRFHYVLENDSNKTAFMKKLIRAYIQRTLLTSLYKSLCLNVKIRGTNL